MINTLNITIKKVSIKIIENLIKTFWLFPVKKNRIVFMSFGGKQISDSPYYIYKELKDDPSLELVWVVTNRNNMLLDKSMKTVKKGSKQYYYMLSRARLIVTNDFLDSYIPIRKKQIQLNTWHGGGWFKRVGLRDSNASEYERNTYVYRAKKVSAFITSSEFFAEKEIKESFGYNGLILRTGMPRSSVLFSGDKNKARKEISDYIGRPIQEDEIVVLYAPTFRGDAGNAQWIDNSDTLDINRTIKSIEKKYNQRVVFLFRAHHAFSRKMHNEENCYDLSNFPDMQLLLLLSDVLISDYSSCMWDEAIQHKPVFVYAPDADEYREKKGTYIDIYEWPFPIAKNQDEMDQIINGFNYNNYDQKINDILDRVKNYDNQDSLSKTVEYIYNNVL